MLMTRGMLRQGGAQPVAQRGNGSGVAMWRVRPLLDVPAQVLRRRIAIARREVDV